MTDIEAKALALLNEVEREQGMSELTTHIMRGLIMDEALCRAIEQHEAFRLEVSDAVEKAQAPVEITCQCARKHVVAFNRLDHLVIPKPNPDPLVEVLEEISGEGGFDNFDHYAYNLHAALEARGFEIREKSK
jgi:hypothetical protein